MGFSKRLSTLNKHLVCRLCCGYFVEATAVVECLHTFCRSCILEYVQNNDYCPICEVEIRRSKLSTSLRPDKILQDLVYKLVPGLYQNEMKRRRLFFEKLDKTGSVPEGEVTGNLPNGARFFAQDDSISLSLEYYTECSEDEEEDEREEAEDEVSLRPRRYLQCPAAVMVWHLKKFLRMKYCISNEHRVDIIYQNECLPEDFTLIDVAYTFSWKRIHPMRFSYRILRKAFVSTMMPRRTLKTTTAMKEGAYQPGAVLPQQSSIEQQRYLGNFNLNPTGYYKSGSRSDVERKTKNLDLILKVQEESQDKSSEDSNASGLRIISEREDSQVSEMSQNSVLEETTVQSKKYKCEVPAFDEDAEDGFATKLKSKHVKKEKRKLDYEYFRVDDKRRKSVGHGDEGRKRLGVTESKKRRKSLVEHVTDTVCVTRRESPVTDDSCMGKLKNEALKKVFVSKEKPDKPELKRKDDEARRKKRKKSKHHEGEAKKKKVIHNTPILSFAKDPLKLKVKLPSVRVDVDKMDEVSTPPKLKPDVNKVSDPLPVKKVPEQAPVKKMLEPVPFRRAPEPVATKKTPDPIPVKKSIEAPEEPRHVTEMSVKKSEERKDTNGGTMTGKERLLHLRAVRHKNIMKKMMSSEYISAPPSLTISKVEPSEQVSAKTTLVESRPSLEIMLIQSKTKQKPDPEKSPKKTDAPKDGFEVLDLSEKSTRVKETSLSPTPPKSEDKAGDKKTTQQSILQIAETLVNKKLSQGSGPGAGAGADAAAAAMRNLMTLSDTAVDILMRAKNQGFSAKAAKPSSSVTSTVSTKPSGTLKIPVYSASRERTNPIPPVPNLHEIFPRARGRPPGPSPRLQQVIKPGQNQTVRQIPNPSVILNRHAAMFHLNLKKPETADKPPTSKPALPSLQNIKKPENTEKPQVPKPFSNNNNIQNGTEKKANDKKIFNNNNNSPGRRGDGLTRNIESVAAGLTARAVSSMIDAK